MIARKCSHHNMVLRKIVVIKFTQRQNHQWHGMLILSAIPHFIFSQTPLFLGKDPWSWENDEVSLGNRDDWGNIKWGIAEKIKMATAVSY